MATLTREANGRKVVQAYGRDGRRRSIRLGDVSDRYAESVRLMVHDLETAAKIGQTPARPTLEWVQGLDARLLDKLARAQLIDAREDVELGAFLDSYIESRIDVKGATATVYGHTRRCLVECFGASKRLRSFTAADAEPFRLHLVGEDLADNTIRRRCSLAKQFMAAAVRQRLIESNPFATLKGRVRGNRARQVFISRDDAARVLAACPDPQWRLLFALARWGGLRVPSELAGLRWSEVHWEARRFLVHSPKTEHHDGHDARWVPIFPELLPHFLAAFDVAEPGEDRVIPRAAALGVNVGTQMKRIIVRAGLTPWAKLFVNLRSTRETELLDMFPVQAVCAWIGNSRAVAMEHYAQVTDEHWARATEAVQKAVQNPVQHVQEQGGTLRQGSEASPAQVLVSERVSRSVANGAVPLLMVQDPPNGPYRTRTCDLIHVKDAR